MHVETTSIASSAGVRVILSDQGNAIYIRPFLPMLHTHKAMENKSRPHWVCFGYSASVLSTVVLWQLAGITKMTVQIL